MLKKPQQAIEIMAFLVFNYRDAWNHGGDYEPILACLTEYHNWLKKVGKLSEDELMILYYQAKIRAGEEQNRIYKLELSKLKNAKKPKVYFDDIVETNK